MRLDAVDEKIREWRIAGAESGHAHTAIVAAVGRGGGGGETDHGIQIGHTVLQVE